MEVYKKLNDEDLKEVTGGNYDDLIDSDDPHCFSCTAKGKLYFCFRDGSAELWKCSTCGRRYTKWSMGCNIVSWGDCPKEWENL